MTPRKTGSPEARGLAKRADVSVSTAERTSRPQERNTISRKVLGSLLSAARRQRRKQRGPQRRQIVTECLRTSLEVMTPRMSCLST